MPTTLKYEDLFEDAGNDEVVSPLPTSRGLFYTLRKDIKKFLTIFAFGGIIDV